MLSKVPNAAEARIDPRKLHEYALNLNHESGRFKAIFFAQMGYSAEAWARLDQDIRTQHLTQNATPGQSSAYGVKYAITAPLLGPLGEQRWVTTVWIIRTGADWPELVTIMPAARRKE